MKILLDECVTKRLKKPLIEAGLDTQTVREVGLNGLKNGKLLAATEKAGFDLLLTTDKNMNYQQNIGRFSLILVLFNALSSNIKFLAPLVPKMLGRLPFMEKGKTYVIEEHD